MEAKRSYRTGMVSLLAMFFLTEGIWGMFSNVVFGILSTNRFHAGIHILLAIWGLYCSLHSSTKLYSLLVGGLLMVVGILRFLPPTGDLVFELLSVNAPVAYLNILIGFVYLLLGMDRSEVYTNH